MSVFAFFFVNFSLVCWRLPAHDPTHVDENKVVASAEELVFALTMLPLVLMVGLGIFRVDWLAVATPPASSDVDWKLFVQIMFWTSTYWQKVSKTGDRFVVISPLLSVSRAARQEQASGLRTFKLR